MEAVLAANVPLDSDDNPKDTVGKKVLAADSFGSAEEAGLSTVCNSSDDEFPSGEAFQSEDERQDSDAQVVTQPSPQPISPEQHAAILQQQFSHLASQQPAVQTAPYTYTISSLDSMTVGQAPTAWLKPRIKIDGPEVFHGLLRANDDTLPATETAPSTETFVAFQGQWRVVTSAGTSSYIGQTMNPWDPSSAAYPLPITYKVSEDEAVVRENTPSASRANSRLGFFERARRFFCTSIAEYMQS